MKLKEYSKKIAELAKKYPNVEVIYSKDDEGNGFQRVSYSPAVGSFDGMEFRGPLIKKEDKEINAICVN